MCVHRRNTRCSACSKEIVSLLKFHDAARQDAESAHVYVVSRMVPVPPLPLALASLPPPPRDILNAMPRVSSHAIDSIAIESARRILIRDKLNRESVQHPARLIT